MSDQETNSNGLTLMRWLFKVDYLPNRDGKYYDELRVAWQQGDDPTNWKLKLASCK